ncbi:MAG: potassium channel protein [Nannocystaceae bacterium]
MADLEHRRGHRTSLRALTRGGGPRLAVGRAARDIVEQLRLLVKTGVALGLVFTTGVIGFLVIGWPRHGLVDAIYMTMITLTTVGYGETIDVSSDPLAMGFVSVLLALGVGTFAFLFSNLTAFVADGGLGYLLGRRRMERMIEGLRDHYIVCGLGETGRHVVEDLIVTKRPFVGVDLDPAHVSELRATLGVQFPALIGDATEDDTLRAAGIDRARGLIACISNDKDNLIVVVSARIINASLRIVSRCIDSSVAPKIRAAGADSVVSPALIGGHRIVSEMVRPIAVSFLETLTRGEDSPVRVEEVPVSPASSYAHIRVGELRSLEGRELLILAVREHGGAWVHNPDDDVVLRPGMSLIFLGTPGTRERLEAKLAP